MILERVFGDTVQKVLSLYLRWLFVCVCVRLNEQVINSGSFHPTDSNAGIDSSNGNAQTTISLSHSLAIQRKIIINDI